MSDQKPRELYLYRDKILGSLHFSPDPVKDADRYEFFNHLIEYSAYENLHQLHEEKHRREKAENQKLKARVQALRDALKHIGGDFEGYCKWCSNFGTNDDEACKHYNSLASEALKHDDADREGV